MSLVMYENGMVFNLTAIDCEQDFEPKPWRVNVNPPPLDGKCECCRNHLSMLREYGKIGDQFSDDLSGQLLIKTFVPSAISDTKLDSDWFEYFADAKNQSAYDRARALFAKRFSEQRATEIEEYRVKRATVKPVWLCTNCIEKSYEEYFAKLIPSSGWNPKMVKSNYSIAIVHSLPLTKVKYVKPRVSSDSPDFAASDLPIWGKFMEYLVILPL